MSGTAKLMLAVGAAAVLWFFMFSPWTSGILNFWLCMSIAAAVLTCLSLYGLEEKPSFKDNPALQIVAGILIAFALWGIFWVGDKVSAMMFDFARPQVDMVYSMKDGISPVLVSLLLLFWIGPAEEFFWRGYVQKTMGDRIGKTAAMFITAIVYALVHIWSFNFMLVMAALVAGGVWGLLYRLKPDMLPALIVSHAVWDALVFVILPI